ncbi:MAG TPA: hypothetical protein PK677_09115 [Acidiphilium sp.]|nr:MAG: hypothetical protein B7Z67_13155 [Acidiphilium sp. 21-60-14]OYV89336.1 MAG: hypothetical protein B7Z57_13070 [Acidiphilium sp. 37-60-79]OZB38299.1 MAG: hypothetical protein B7X48_13745 [Acidiphilium sp. 34-60-192]HQT88696.1 hypothetical protein [Acidiphilium sp.]HQU25076.1 hypothetical protein [Acidiphilium sp.]
MARKRNPMARDLLTNPLYRSKRTKSRFEREAQKDRWNRRGKHKGATKSFEPGAGSGDFFCVGEGVEFMNFAAWFVSVVESG